MPRSDSAKLGGSQAEERAAILHRALADRRRAWIVHELRSARGGLSVEDFADRLHLHPNTVRWHLRVLEEAALVFAQADAPTTRGRPRQVYRLTADGVIAEGSDERLLVLVLADVVARCVDALPTAEHTGYEWGRYLAQRPSPLAPAGSDEVIAELALTLDRLGFSAEPAENGVRLHTSSLEGLVARHPRVVEALLRGVVAGVLVERSSGLELSRLSFTTDAAEALVALRPRPVAPTP